MEKLICKNDHCGLFGNCHEAICSYAENNSNKANGDYAVLCAVAVDKRQYLSIVSDLKDNWKGGMSPEYRAMDYIAERIYDKFIVSKK